jgi:carboxyl-terminal processing protease
MKLTTEFIKGEGGILGSATGGEGSPKIKMIKTWLKPFLIVALIFTLGTPPALSVAAQESGDFLAQRTKLLSYLLRQQLTGNHYSQKPIDDELSQASFDLYLKQLDFQKRFLLKQDIARLRAYAFRIDDEFNQGVITLPSVSADIMSRRIALVNTMVGEILTEDFDFSIKESIETDPEKLEYCEDAKELRDRWRKSLKYQVLSRYLNLLEDEGVAEGKPASADPEKTPEALLRKAREKVLKSHEDFFSRMLQESEQDHYDRYFNVVTRAFDPHTNYLPPRQKEDFDISMRGSLEGIGATLKEEDGYIKVVQIIPGSAAYRQGQLHTEDIILAVAEAGEEPVDITDTRIRDAVSLIRGKKGTEVRLTVKKPDGTRLVVPIIRDVVQIEESFVKSTTLTDEESGRTYGYIKIPAFYRDFEKTQNGGKGRNSTDDVRTELIKLKAAKIDGLVLDLRNNGGGALTDAVAITGLFIDKGPVVQVRNSDGKTQVLSDEDPGMEYAGPMVVLVNQFSASASEILAGALQDYGRAVVMGGQHTHGKGTVQAMIDLNYRNPLPNMEKYAPLGALKVTIQKFYRVSGASTQYRGVVPDIILPDRLKHLKTGEQYIDYSLPWDTVKPVGYKKWVERGIDLPTLRANSERRISTDEEFIKVAEAAKRAGERMEQTLQSLNMEDLRREREEAKRFGDKSDEEGSPHAGKVEGENKNPAEEWLKTVREDPYAGEAMAVLGDMLMSNKDGVLIAR